VICDFCDSDRRAAMPQVHKLLIKTIPISISICFVLRVIISHNWPVRAGAAAALVLFAHNEKLYYILYSLGKNKR
jgi:hypothetical protein